MTADGLRAAAIEIWGERGWTSSLSAALGVERTQVWRYLNGRTPVPGPVRAAVTCWLACYRRDGTRPPPQTEEGD
ncbi:helix-turn-helix domain-containing protein [Enterovirga rhinocerotis]|uniref:YdaS antitoxin of YdaST toxin-antitoxin system n=1 Tax=Enterovirga rhinocerotis TaxID=1339210 RepID=A0A4V3DYZ8_9HYPH|nr:helix-turn-helix domain-containing protein [Enterovirga rhinocerotis]TDR94599.1 hypothetical protein EV668_1887 [Enterovirga rhinocerotis]